MRLLAVFGLCLVLAGQVAALEPMVQADLLLLRALDADSKKDYDARAKAMAGILELQKKHDLEFPSYFSFEYAKLFNGMGKHYDAWLVIRNYLENARRSDQDYFSILRIYDNIQDSAIEDGGMEVVEALIESGKDVNSAIKLPLRYAACGGHTEAIKVLIEAGADVNLAERYGGNTSLHQVVQNCEAEAVKALIEAGADVNVVNGKGKTPLYYAMERDNDEIQSILKSHGAR